MQKEKLPFAYMGETYNEIMETLKSDGSKATYRDAEQTVGMNPKSMTRLKKGQMSTSWHLPDG